MLWQNSREHPVCPVPQRSSMELGHSPWDRQPGREGRAWEKKLDHGEWRLSPGPRPILGR